MTRHQKRLNRCQRPPHSGKLSPCSCVLRLSVLRAYWEMPGDQGVCVLECCLEPNVQGITLKCGKTGLISCQTCRDVRYRVDVLPNLPTLSGTGIGVVPIRYIRAHRYRRYRC